MLSLMQKDVLTELVNTYIAEAASSLSDMVNEKVILNIPEVELITLSEFEQLNNMGIDLIHSGHIVTSSIRFGHQFTGTAFLIFSADQAKALINACIGEQILLEDSTDEIALFDTDFDVLKEISNIILNAVIGEFGNLLNLKLEYSLPEIELISVANSEKEIVSQSEMYILVLHTSFLLSETEIKGNIFIAFSMTSVTILLEKIDELLGDMNE